MSSNLLNDFIDRKKQVRHYISVVATAERLFDRSTISRAQENRLMTLRSGTFLVLYNLIESSVRLAIESIHDQVVREHVEFQKLNPTMRREVLRLFRLDSKSKLHENPINFPSALVAAALGQEFRLSGNVDAKMIRELGEIYGFSTATETDLTWGGSDLRSIKDNRNDLAHGRKSYEEVGRIYTIRDLMNIARRSSIYIGTIVTNIDKYIENGLYREA